MAIAFFLTPIVSIALCFASTSFVASAQHKDSSRRSGVIVGRVTVEGKPAGGAEIHATDANNWSSPGARPLAEATTDADGNFRLEHLPAGVVTVEADLPGYTLKGYDSLGFRSVTIAEGETLEGIDLALERGGAITGRVTDADGRPLVAEQISIKRMDATTDVPQEFRFRFSTYSWLRRSTDDRGIYRLWGLAPGRYIVWAGGAEGMGLGRSGGYQQTYYPATANEAEATVVEVTPGGEVSGIDLVLRRAAPGFRVSGRAVLAGTDTPVPKRDVYFAKVEQNHFVAMRSGSQTDARGEFAFSGLAPGDYAVFLSGSGSEAASQDATYSDVVRVSVVDANVENVVLAVERGATVTGRLRLEGKSPEASLADYRISLGIRPSDESTTLAIPIAASSPVAADGSFAITGLRPGLQTVSVHSKDGRDSVMITRVERDATALERGVELAKGDVVDDLVVTAAVGTGSVRGAVEITNVPSGRRYVIVVLRRPDLPSWQGYGGVDERNQFLFERLPAGAYTLQAALSVESDRKTWKRYESKPQEISVGATRVDATVEIVVGPETEVQER
jgi:protocatechuate 3,4-dioxygenase beta subunit